MSTSFVVVPPKVFRKPLFLPTLNSLFGNARCVSVWDVWAHSGCSMEDAKSLIFFLARQNHGHIRQGPPLMFYPKLPITFVASLESKPFAAGGRR